MIKSGRERRKLRKRNREECREEGVRVRQGVRENVTVLEVHEEGCAESGH